MMNNPFSLLKSKKRNGEDYTPDADSVGEHFYTVLDIPPHLMTVDDLKEWCAIVLPWMNGEYPSYESWRKAHPLP